MKTEAEKFTPLLDSESNKSLTLADIDIVSEKKEDR